MFRRILVAVDGSPPSNAGLKSAVQLALDQRAPLVVLHVIDDSMASLTFEGSSLPTTYMDTYSKALSESGERVLDKAVTFARNAGVKVDPAMVRARTRTVARAIIDQARKSNVDVIVLGTHGRRGLRRALLGSDAEAVVREAAVPVLLLRGGIKAPRDPSASRKGVRPKPASQTTRRSTVKTVS
jgi:nucleotide-binding universal stress UspA family protein